MVCFLHGLIELDVRISRIQLSDRTHVRHATLGRWSARRHRGTCRLGVSKFVSLALQLNSPPQWSWPFRTAWLEALRVRLGFGLIATFPLVHFSPSAPEPGPRPSTGFRRLRRYHEPLRHLTEPLLGVFGSRPRPVRSPVLRTFPCKRAVPITPVDRWPSSVDFAPASAAAFPFIPQGLHPRHSYRGLLRLHSLRPACLLDLLSKAFCLGASTPRSPETATSPDSFRGVSTTPRAGFPPAGNVHPHGARKLGRSTIHLGI